MQQPAVIGITGGIGSGKSTVASMLAELGAEVIDADALGHEALRRDDVKEQLREAWGEGVFDASGEVDRRALAAEAFGGESQARRLNAIVHPPILAEIRRQVQACRAKALVLDAALLIESGLDAICDVVVFVDAPAAVRRERVAARGWTDRELQNREARQSSIEEKRKRSQYVIENGTARENTLAQVVQFWNENAK